MNLVYFLVVLFSVIGINLSLIIVFINPLKDKNKELENRVKELENGSK